MSKWNINPFSGYQGQLKWLEQRTIFVTVHGSQCYGTSTPESDIDIKGLCIPPKEYFFGFLKNFEQVEGKDPHDMVIYGLHKFFKLAADCNPNIIEVINTEPEDWVLHTPLFEKIYKNRHLFLSKKAQHTFSGYAVSQLKRIKSHKKWLLHPPSHEPTREEYGLPTNSKMSQSDLGATTKLIENNVPISDKVMTLFQLEQKYQAAKKEWAQYQQWKKERNKKRAALEAKFGFDLKHAMHLVRLLKMAHEILDEGIVKVRRPDAEELKEIRNGAWAYDELIDWAEKQKEAISAIVTTSSLPKQPNKEKIDQLCIELTEEAISRDKLR